MSAHNTPSFYASPQEALEGAAGGVPLCRLPARGHGRRRAGLPRRRRRRERADRPRDADAERRRRAPPLRLEPLQLRLPRAGPLAPDRARLPLVADPHRQRRGRPAPAADREGDRAGGARREDRLHAPPHRALHAGRQRRDQHARRRGRERRRRVRRPRREDLRGQGPLGERRRDAAAQLRLLVPAAQERARLLRVRRAERLREGLRPRRRRGGPLRQPAPLLEPRRAQRSSRRSTSASRGSSRSRSAGSTTPRPRRASSAPRSRARCGASAATTAAGRPSR